MNNYTAHEITEPMKADDTGYLGYRYFNRPASSSIN